MRRRFSPPELASGVGSSLMEAAEFAGGVLSGIPRALHIALDGIDPAKLTYRPGEHCNSIAWLVWHLTRVQDRLVSSLSNQEQAWVAEGWHAKFGRPADPADAGMGHGPEDVGTIKPDSPQVLLDYYDAVCKRTLDYANGLSDADLD